MRSSRFGVWLASLDRWDWFVGAATCVAFAYYFFYRVRYVGDCDPASYYLESLRFRGLHPIQLDSAVPVRAPLAPLCMNLVGHDRVVSLFPPGFPLLLALAGWLGAPFATMPVMGASSGLLLYKLLKPRAPAGVAVAMVVAWFCSPLVFYGATQVMSDMPATVFVMLGVLAQQTKRSFLAGLLVAAAVGIRPAAVLVGPALLVMVPRLRPTLRLGLGALTGLAAWVLFLSFDLRGQRVPYLVNVGQMTGAFIQAQLVYLLRATAETHLPHVILALAGVARSPRLALPYLVWAASFYSFHAFWGTPFEAWWWTRYVMPALPAIFILASDGVVATLPRLDGRARKFGAAALFAVTLGYGLWGVVASPARYAQTTVYHADYAQDAERVRLLVPSGALVGAVNESGSLRLYGGIESFFVCHWDARQLVDWGLRQGRGVFVVLWPADKTCGTFDGLRLLPVGTLPSGAKLLRVEAHSPPHKIDMGTPEARPHLGGGWSIDEAAGPTTFVWAVGHRAVILPPALEAPGEGVVQIHLAPYERGKVTQHLDVVAGGEKLASFDLKSGYQTITAIVPKRRSLDPIELLFANPRSPAKAGGSDDIRELAAAVDWVAFESRDP